MIFFKPRPISVPNVNCERLEAIMGKIKMGPTGSKLNELKAELNRLFKMSTCDTIIYTKNTDKPFFGMCVMPVITDSDVKRILLNTDDMEISKKYFLEFDSKLFDIGLNRRELTAILLHEIGHVALEVERAANEVSKCVFLYLQKNNDTIDVDNVVKYSGVLSFGIKDALRKINNIFEDDEIQADSYAVALGYGDYLRSALEKITASVSSLNKSVTNNKLLILQWTLRMYKDVKFKRVPAIQKLQKCYEISGSELEKREIKTCIDNIKKIEYNKMTETMLENMIYETKNSMSIFRKFKHRNMRNIEDDIYEYALRIKSVDEQDEALIILRDINTRLAIVDDYLSDPNLDQKEIDKWMKVRRRYMELRDELSKKTTYDDKYYGLFVKTPVIKSRYEI